jgi:hypothetical protein
MCWKYVEVGNVVRAQDRGVKEGACV